MDRESVTSSNIASIGYDPESSTLEVEFKNGSVYQYFDVGQSAYEELINSDSVGGFLASHIKGTYRFSRA